MIFWESTLLQCVLFLLSHTYSFKHWDFVQLQGFLGLAPVASIADLQMIKKIRIRYMINTWYIYVSYCLLDNENYRLFINRFLILFNCYLFPKTIPHTMSLTNEYVLLNESTSFCHTIFCTYFCKNPISNFGNYHTF